jgi:hypothetical protein
VLPSGIFWSIAGSRISGATALDASRTLARDVVILAQRISHRPRALMHGRGDARRPPGWDRHPAAPDREIERLEPRQAHGRAAEAAGALSSPSLKERAFSAIIATIAALRPSRFPLVNHMR